ncbi:MAG TPA: ABC transporter permease [Armatimonadota bacterium]
MTAKPQSISFNKRSRLSSMDAIGLVGIYLILLVFLAIRAPFFLTAYNFLNILVAVSTIGIISVAMTMVIVSAGIDLSVGSVVALSGVAIAHVGHGRSVWLGVFAALCVGLIVGAVNGLSVTRLRINPLIATLGTMSIARGLAFVFSGGLTQSITDDAFGWLGRGFVYGVPFHVLVMALMFIIAAWVMRHTVFGRSVYAIGGNEQASRLAGLPVQKVQMAVFVLCGLCAALGGVFQASQLGAAAPAAANGIEMSVIAAVILGGTSLSGGKGTIWGTLLGVLIMGTLNNGLNLMQLSSYWQDVARGSVLLLAVGLDQLRLRLAER